MSVYQQIKNKFIMKNAWEDWASYRDQLTDLVAGLLAKLQPQGPVNSASGRVAIIGAGRCNDVDLRRLAASSGNVILMDVDSEAMREAVAALPENLRQKAECREASITGINEDDMDSFCNDTISFARAAGRNLTMETFRRQLMTGLDDLADKLVRKEDDLLKVLPEASVDILVCCGVCSQLFSTLSFFIRSLLHSLQEILPGVEALENEVNERIRSMDDYTVPIINQALCKAAQTAIVFGNEYMPDRPVEGAHQCIENVRKHFQPEEIHLTWDFNRAEGITYDMLIQVCRVGGENWDDK